MRSFVDRYGQSAPDDNVQVLNHWLTKSLMHQIYQEETTEPQLALKTFYQHFKQYFGANRVDKSDPQVRISKYSSHSVCDQCLALNQNRREAKTEEEMKNVKYLKALHTQNFTGARIKMEEIKQKALQFPLDNVVLQIDGE